MMPCGFIEYDSVRFSDGSYAVHRLQYAPQNSLTEFFDNKGRTIATIARASECMHKLLCMITMMKDGCLISSNIKVKSLKAWIQTAQAMEGTKKGILAFDK